MTWKFEVFTGELSTSNNYLYLEINPNVSMGM